MYETDIELLPEEVIDAITNLRVALFHTDFDSIQLSLTDIKNGMKYTQRMHVIVSENPITPIEDPDTKGN